MGISSIGGGGGGTPAVAGIVAIGPRYGQEENMGVGAAVDFDGLAIGPIDVATGLAVGLSQLDLGPFNDALGAQVDFAALDIGPLNNAIGAAVSGRLTFDDMEATDDTYLDETPGTDINGSVTTLIASSGDALGNNERKIYIAWDLTWLVAAGITVTSASIDIYAQTTALLGESSTVSIFTNDTQPFDETTATWNADEPPPGTLRQSTSVNWSTSYTTVTLTLDGTTRAAMTNRWLYIQIVGASLLGVSSVQVRSKEFSTSSQRPKLSLEITL